MVDRDPAPDFVRAGGTGADVLGAGSAQVIPLPGRERQSRSVAEPHDAEVLAMPAVRKARIEPEPDPLTRALEFVHNRLTGNYDVDEFGFDEELTESLVLPVLRVLYDKWFRVTTYGDENLPADGGALLVFNHSGTIPLDALMASVAVHEASGRHARHLAADLVFKLPFVGPFARKVGHTLACNADAERLLNDGELVGVFPEGFKGIGKPFSSRYKLQRFGRGGFVAAALRSGVPIVPCAIVGAEEIYPKIGDIKPLARLLGLPYFPVTPLFPLLGPLGAIPLPTKWHIEFGDPVRTDAMQVDVDDPMAVFTVADQVRETIQRMLYARLAERGGVFR
ncbi:lysophospholipid acyltransferase family protein [Thermocrispum municipale]|jgi:1-acyl-sn-glycerol-3-phosphate acyltransferase|uniref:lysophospholipid acyltransferase family protein n=1 Tax=Thermocrispum municipale TaxID=37926 RepID=UPI0006937184|nr:lysophospholipid acyltransferase family protein [Thermocrispum municipale]